jgi:hypothetical protein
MSTVKSYITYYVKLGFISDFRLHLLRRKIVSRKMIFIFYGVY